MRIYLDIETYRPEKEDAFIGEKLVAVGVLEDWTRYVPESADVWDSESVRFHYFTEWDLGGESQVVTKFYNYLQELIQDWRRKKIGFLNVVGFNILRYDIPFLIQKGIEYGIGTPADLMKLWHNTFTIDYFQATLPFHGMKFKNLNIEYLVIKAKDKGVKVPEPYGSGSNVKEWYENREYESIIRHLESDLKIIRVIDLNYQLVYGL